MAAVLDGKGAVSGCVRGSLCRRLLPTASVLFGFRKSDVIVRNLITAPVFFSKPVPNWFHWWLSHRSEIPTRVQQKPLLWKEPKVRVNK